MTTQAQLQKHFEGLLGHPIGAFDDVVLLRERTSLDVLEQEGEVVSREIGTTGSSTKGCGRSALIDVGGLSVTDGAGTAKFLLSDYICRRGGRDNARIFGGPVIFVATPQSDQPCFLTSRQWIVASPNTEFEPNDVEVVVFAWDKGGARVNRVVAFDWRCMVAVSWAVT